MRLEIDNLNIRHHQNQDLRFVFNSRLLDKKVPPRILIVIDNPGRSDLKNKEYLSGRAGKNARNILVNYNIIDKYPEDVAVLCKTPLYTETPDKLRSVEIKYDKLYELSQEFMADILIDLMKVLPLCETWVLEPPPNNKSYFKYYYSQLEFLTKTNPDIGSRIRYLKSFANSNFELDFLRTFYRLHKDATVVSEIIDKMQLRTNSEASQ
ncbi:MAG: hypothetical protein ABIJ16_09035 [Bacteroidota bacterium]